MGKYDGIVKYLGKEDSFTPDQIKQGIESSEKMDSLNDMSGISQQDMANVDKLISGSSASSAVAAQPTGDLHVDPEVLKEMEGLDAEPPNLEELQSRLQVTNYETPTEELMEEMTSEEEPIQDVPADEETPDVNIFEPQFSKKKETPEEEIPLPPMLDETTGQDAAAGSDTDNVSDLLSQLKPTEQSIPEIPTDISTPAETEIHVPEAAFEVPDKTSEPDLSSVFGPLEGSTQTAETPVEGMETGKPPEDFAFEMPKMDDVKGPAKDDFELPADFGMKDETPEAEHQPVPFDTSRLPKLDEDETRFETPIDTAPVKKKKEVHDEFMDLKDEFQDKKTKGEMPEILKPVKETKTTYGMDMDPDKAVKIRNKINKIVNPMLRKKVRHAFIEGKLPEKIMQQLIPMLLLGEEEQNIAELIDQYVPESLIREKEAPPVEKGAKPKRKVIHTEESLRAKDFQRDLQNITRYSFILFFLVILLGFFFWKGVWTPYNAGIQYRKGLDAIKMDDYKIAEAKFEAGKSIGGPDNKWYNKFAKAYEEKKQFDYAKKKYVEGLENKPLDKETIKNYSHFYTIQYPPNYDYAVQLYKRLLKEYPNDFDYIDQSAQIYIQWGDATSDATPGGAQDKVDHYKTADELYAGYLMKNPKHIPSYYQQLNIALRGTNSERIDLIYDKIDELNKGAVNDPILTRLVTYYIDNRSPTNYTLDRAKKVFEKLIRNDNKIDESFYQYARYLTINFDYTRAINAVQRVTNLNPKLGKAYNLMGEIYYNNDTIPNNVLLAKQLFDSAVELSPGMYKPLANLGNIYFYNNLNFPDPEEALGKAFEYYKRSYLLYERNGDKKDDNLLYNLGWLYYYFGLKQKDIDSVVQAQGLFDQLYQADKANPVLSYVMGNTYYNLYMLGKKNHQYLNFAKMQFSKAIEYYQAIADKINYVNPNVDRHREVYGQLSRCFNNRGVVDATYSRMDAYGKVDKSSDYDGQALLDFYKSKDYANKINSVYTFAEYNIKYILNKNMKTKKPAFDDELMKRTTLQKLIEELRLKMINNI